jgi:hypothetical protein
MKKNQKQLAVKNFIFTFLFSISCLFGIAQENKNEVNLSTGISIPLITISNTSENVASQGSNFSFNYGRVISRSEKRYLTLNTKYFSVSNSYSLLDSNVKDLNSNPQLTSLSGVWNGNADKFKLSSYLVGFGFHSYLSKNKKLTSYAKIYIGNATLISPSLNYTSKNGYSINVEEVKNSNFIYTSNAGFSYDVLKNISLGLNVEYAKSSFNFDNQELVYFGANGAGRDSIDPYAFDYSTLNVNAELIFKF